MKTLADGPAARGGRGEHLRQRGPLPRRRSTPAAPPAPSPRPRPPRLHAAVRDVLREAIDFRGTTLLDYRDASGERGGFARAAARLRPRRRALPRLRRPRRAHRPGGPLHLLLPGLPDASPALRLRALRLPHRPPLAIFRPSAFIQQRRSRTWPPSPFRRISRDSATAFASSAEEPPRHLPHGGGGRGDPLRGEVEAGAHPAALLLPREGGGEGAADRAARRTPLAWEYEPSEFAALLRELELIKRFRPRFNVRHKRDGSYSFLKLSAGSGAEALRGAAGGRRRPPPTSGPSAAGGASRRRCAS